VGGAQALNLMTHPLIKRLQDKGIDPAETITLAGYLVVSGDGKQARIFLDLHFCAFVAVPAGDILYVQPPDASDETKPTHIVLKAGSSITLAGSASVGSSFLRGAITSTHPPAIKKPLKVFSLDQIDCKPIQPLSEGMEGGIVPTTPPS
jgi:hypothetical protein